MLKNYLINLMPPYKEIVMNCFRNNSNYTIPCSEEDNRNFIRDLMTRKFGGRQIITIGNFTMEIFKKGVYIFYDSYKEEGIANFNDDRVDFVKEYD